MSNTCSLYNSTYVWPVDSKRHLESKHGQQKSTLKQQQPYTSEQQQQQPYTLTPERQQQPYTFTPDQQQQQPYSQSNEEEPYYILKTNNPDTFYIPDKYDPDHFMPWDHPFTSVISGPTGSGKSVFVRRFVHNIKHMMTPKPDHILWCYGEYQTLYGTVDGVDFQQGLPDLDTFDPRDKHLIILDDLMDETDQRVASLFTKKSHHRIISVQNLFHRGKHHRTISLNAHYMVVFKNQRDASQIMPWRIKCIPKGRTTFWKPTLQPLLNPTAI